MKPPPRHHLADWLKRQRWYAAPALDPDRLALSVLGVAEHQGLCVSLTVASVDDPISGRAHYLVPLASSSRCDASITDPIYRGDLEWFDALAHEASARMTLELMHAARPSVQSTWLETEPLDLSTVLTTTREQSNSSVVLGQHFAKLVRRLQPGLGPEVEVGQALRESRHVAALSGWSRLETPDGPADALIIHRLIHGRDGFALAADDAHRDMHGETGLHFPGAAYELGITLGAGHADLVEAFGERRSDSYATELSALLTRRLDALSDLELLAPYRAAASETFDALARFAGPLVTHRLHGDMHLGQTLFSNDGWKLIDFEGEPRRPLAERRLPGTPMRDLAGLLRSIDYAARWHGSTDRSAAWRERTSAMFLEGYRLVRPDVIEAPVLDALVLDKALYEVGYEALHRPERVRIPLAAVAALCAAS